LRRSGGLGAAQGAARLSDLRIVISEGSIGWVPYLMERADFSNNRHKAWTRSLFQNIKPSDVIRRHFMHCFMHDPYGLKNLKEVGEDMVAFEVDIRIPTLSGRMREQLTSRPSS